MRRQNLARETVFTGGLGFSSNGEILPADLLKAENTLVQLASVFFLTDPFGEHSTANHDIPGLADVYRILVEQIPAIVFIAFFDKSFGEAYVSPQIEASLGFTQEEWLNDPIRWYQHIHPDDKERWSTEAAKMFLTGEPLHSIYRVLARDGRVVWFQCEVKMVRHDDGQPWFIQGVGFDITEQKMAEAARNESEEMLSGIFEYAPDTMVVVGTEGRIERVNARVEQMFGYRSEELLGHPIEILIPHANRERHVKHRKKYVAEPHLRPMGVGLKLNGRRKDSSEFPVEIMLSPVTKDSDGPVIAVIRDNTRRQRDEEVLREYADRMKVLSQSLLDVQESERRQIALELHDQIGQILTGLKLKLEMIGRKPGTALKEQFDETQDLVNELIARTRALSLDLRPATLDHLGLLSALHRHLRHYASQTNIHVDLRHVGLEGRRFTPELETASFRIVQEALTNVARHSGSKDALVSITVDHGRLTMVIEDHGIGFITEDKMAAGQSSGLTGMRERATLLGGSFDVESDANGTRLTVEWNLPRLDS
ncbi:MAG: PAS domain S-box protein [Acidobacteriota bacterium]